MIFFFFEWNVKRFLKSSLYFVDLLTCCYLLFFVLLFLSSRAVGTFQKEKQKKQKEKNGISVEYVEQAPA